MQLKLYNWIIIDNNGKSILRQGVVTASSKKVAKEYLVASMSKDELFLNKNTTLSLVAIYSYTE